MRIDSTEDTPSDLIHVLIGWMAWNQRPETYEEGLIDLKEMIEHTLEKIKCAKKAKTKYGDNAL